MQSGRQTAFESAEGGCRSEVLFGEDLVELAIEGVVVVLAGGVDDFR